MQEVHSNLNPERNSYLKETMPDTTQLVRKNSSTIKKHYSYEHIPMNKPIPAWNQSVATLRNSSTKFTFSKDTRFKTPKVNYFSHIKLDYPSTITKRATNFGIGKKLPIPNIFLNGKFKDTANCPFYNDNQRQTSVSLQKGKTFGLPWSSYDKVRTPHRNTIHTPSQVKISPGPQYYDTINSGKYPSPRGKMHQRLKMFTSLRADYVKAQPCPQTYKISLSQTNIKSRSAAIGYDKKTDFTKTTKTKVGPIYNIASFTDKFLQTMRKNM